jgi:hypothetical protein
MSLREEVKVLGYELGKPLIHFDGGILSSEAKENLGEAVYKPTIHVAVKGKWL